MAEYMVTPILVHPGGRFEWLQVHQVHADSAKAATDSVADVVRRYYETTIFTLRATNVADYADTAGYDHYPA